jgi:hypothetical protein
VVYHQAEGNPDSLRNSFFDVNSRSTAFMHLEKEGTENENTVKLEELRD